VTVFCVYVFLDGCFSTLADVCPSGGHRDELPLSRLAPPTTSPNMHARLRCSVTNAL
jgi:hypothetical protein